MLDGYLDPVIGPKVPLGNVLSPFWPLLVIAFVGSLMATPIARRLAFRFGILDMPNDTVKIHKQPTAYLGGTAILVGFILAMSVGSFVIAKHSGGHFLGKTVLAVCLGAVLSCIVGLIDDIVDLRPWQKLLGQAVCAIFLVWGGVKPELNALFEAIGMDLPSAVLDVFGYLIVLFFVLGASNSLNLIDGLDGLCTGVTAIITVGFMILAIHLATWGSNPPMDPIRVGMTMALVGAALGFLIFNHHPAKIFLGDAGSILLGFIIASMMMLFSVRCPRWWMASVMIFGLPILDTGTALIRRALNKRPLFVSDRGHIYDQMIDRGISLSRTVAINYLLAGLYAVIGILGAIFLHTRHAFWVYLAVGVISFTVVGAKGYFRMSGYRGAVQKHEESVKNTDQVCF